MGYEPTVFNQLFNFIPRHTFEKSAACLGADRYRRLIVLLRRDGWTDNHKRIERIYREENYRFRSARSVKPPINVKNGQLLQFE